MYISLVSLIEYLTMEKQNEELEVKKAKIAKLAAIKMENKLQKRAERIRCILRRELGKYINGCY